MAAVFQNHASFADARHQNQCGHKHYWLPVSFRYHHGTDTGRTGILHRKFKYLHYACVMAVEPVILQLLR